MAKTPRKLGDLETEIMTVVWARGEASVQDVKDALEPKRPLAYTTVMTVMSRLAEKGILNRRKEGRAYVYTPAASQKSTASSMLRALVRSLYHGATGEAIAHLLEEETDVEDAELDRLEELIEARRKKSKK
jgi:predicted transcriptional regulator